MDHQPAAAPPPDEDVGSSSSAEEDDGQDSDDDDDDDGDGPGRALTDEERADEAAFGALADWLHNANVPPQVVHAFIGDDSIDPRAVIPDAPQHIIDAALRARFVRTRATRSNYITSATGIGKLGVAAAAGDIDGCRHALQYTDVNTRSQFDGRTAVWLAAEEGHEETVRWLAAQGAKLDEPADMEAYHNGGWGRRGLSAACGCTPLYAAARRGHTSVVSALLLLGADPNAADELGRTPLSAACKQGHVAVVRRLAEQNDMRHRNGVLARFLPQREGEGEVEDEYRKAVAVAGASPAIDLDRPTCIGRTPFFMAAEANSLEIVQTLADYGADWSAPENQGYRPVDAAAAQRADGIVELLERINAVPSARTVQLHVVAELRLAWAKACSARLGEECVAALWLPYDLLEMIAAYLPLRISWPRVFELQAMAAMAMATQAHAAAAAPAAPAAGGAGGSGDAAEGCTLS
jgi:hypothetical protein